MTRIGNSELKADRQTEKKTQQTCEKKSIRREVLALRDALTEQERQRGNILVTEKILGHQWYYGAEYLLLFADYGSEIDTSLIFEDALTKGKQVFFPKVEGRDMVFYRVTDKAELIKGYKSIREPAGDTDIFEFSPEIQEKTLMIMPGVAFDVTRHRIGYGGGFYDRYLAEKPGMRTIAIGYQCQMLPEIPYEERDIRPGQIICF